MSDPCPVCGSTEREIDYIGPDERRVDFCVVCEWPGQTPMSVEEYRERWEARKLTEANDE